MEHNLPGFSKGWSLLSSVREWLDLPTRLPFALPFLMEGRGSAQLGALVMTLLCVVCASLLFNAWNSRRRPGKQLPGPHGVFLFGFTPSDHEKIAELVEEYGPVFQISTWFKRIIIISEPRAAATVLIDAESFMPKPHHPQHCMNEMLQANKHPCLLTNTSSGPAWQAVRRCLAKSFSVAEIREDFEVAKDKSLAIVELLAKIKPGAAVSIDVLASGFSLDVLGAAKLGYDFGTMQSAGGDVPLLSLLKSCGQELALRTNYPWRRYAWLVNDDVADSGVKYTVLQAFMNQVWHAIEKRGSPPDDNTTLAAQLMRLRDSGVVSESMVRAELAGMLVAGHEALGQSLAWALQLLASHPDVQEKLFKEMEATGFVESPELLSFDTVGCLSYLDAVVREVLRLQPTFGSVITRVAAKDMLLGEYKVPRGSQVCVHPYAMHRTQRLWLHPTSFIPERWLCKPHGSETDAVTEASALHQRHNGMATWPDVWQAHAAMMGANDQQGPNPPPHEDSDGPTKRALEAGSSLSDPSGPSAGQGATRGGGQEGLAEGQGGRGNSKNISAAEGAHQLHLEQPQLCASHAFMPFGIGQRSCVGQVFAQATLKAALSMIIMFYSFSPGKKPRGQSLDNHMLPLRFQLRDA